MGIINNKNICDRNKTFKKKSAEGRRIEQKRKEKKKDSQTQTMCGDLVLVGWGAGVQVGEG